MSFKWTNWIGGGLGAAAFLAALALSLFHDGFRAWEEQVKFQALVGDNARSEGFVPGLFCMGGLLVGGAIGFIIDLARFIRASRDPQRDPFSPWQELD